MRLKIRCDGESEKFYKIFWELNKALCFGEKNGQCLPIRAHTLMMILLWLKKDRKSSVTSNFSTPIDSGCFTTEIGTAWHHVTYLYYHRLHIVTVTVDFTAPRI